MMKIKLWLLSRHSTSTTDIQSFQRWVYPDRNLTEIPLSFCKIPNLYRTRGRYRVLELFSHFWVSENARLDLDWSKPGTKFNTIWRSRALPDCDLYIRNWTKPNENCRRHRHRHHHHWNLNGQTSCAKTFNNRLFIVVAVFVTSVLLLF